MSMLRRLRIHFHFHFSRKCIREIKNNVIAVRACAVLFMDIISLTFVNIFMLHAYSYTRQRELTSENPLCYRNVNAHTSEERKFMPE